MFYSDVDISCIQPTHIAQQQSHVTQDEIKDDMCSICHEEMNTINSRKEAESINDVIQLSCGHMFHYTCLRDACLLSKVSNSRMCSLCRAPYAPMQRPNDDVFHKMFHKTPPKNAHLYKEVDWNTIEPGTSVHIVKHSSHHKNAIYMSQTKCYARLKSSTGQTFQCIKHNVLMYK